MASTLTEALASHPERVAATAPSSAPRTAVKRTRSTRRRSRSSPSLCSPSTSASSSLLSSSSSSARDLLAALPSQSSSTSNISRMALSSTIAAPALRRTSWTPPPAGTVWSDYRLASASCTSSSSKVAGMHAVESNASPILPPPSPASSNSSCESDDSDMADSATMASSSSATSISDASSVAMSCSSSLDSLASAESASSSISSASTSTSPSTTPRRTSKRRRMHIRTATSPPRIADDCFPSPRGSSCASFPPSQWAAKACSRGDVAQLTASEDLYTFPAPTQIEQLKGGDIESCLRFSTCDKAVPEPDSTAPPAFFPLQRVSFAPQVKVRTPGGIPLAIGGTAAALQLGRQGIAGMMLGVTGMVEIVDVEKSKRAGREIIKSQRMIADFATDLTNGLRIWKRDAAPIVKEKLRVEKQYRAHHGLPTEDLSDPSWGEMLAPGTFMLPLSMKIPCSDKLPPSFESAHFRIRYTMSLAIFSSRIGRDGRPEVLHKHSMPFHILPSTLPSPAPHIPMLTHDARRNGFLAGLGRAFSFSSTSASASKQLSDKTCTHIVCPSIPTSSFSPGSIIPITLRIADCPSEPTDLYIRLSLVRKIYVRDSSHEALNEWGLPDDIFFEEFCREEEEIVSRWGYVPYAIRAREGATPGQKAQVVISDISLPVSGVDGEWKHGYSSFLELAPSVVPSMQHGECSWFSPALSQRLPNKADYDRFVHTSARHFISIEVGFAPASLIHTLREISECVPEMEIPAPNTFTEPRPPATSALSGVSTTNPFQVASPSSTRTRRASNAPFQHAPQLPGFPGKMKEILIPITIGSVAEPQMSCIAARIGDAQPSIIPPSPPRSTPAATPEESAMRAARDLDETESERQERVGDDGEEAWLCPPPCYTNAITSAPAYL